MESFKDSGLHESIVKGVEALGFTEPTPIQKMALEHLLYNATDLIAFAQTGTGKTAAFSLPILDQLEEDVQHVQAIVLAPTRELCLQIATDIESYAKYTDVKITAVYGGSPISKQIKSLQARPHIVVGTPGRTLDLIERGKLRINDVNFLVLDEADEMLSMGFQDELDAILANTPEEKQTLMFSATMPDGMKKLTKKYMHEPHEISAGKRNLSASTVVHHLYTVASKNTYEAMRRVMDAHPDMYGIVFCRTRRETNQVAEKLMNDGYRAEALNGDLSQAQRDDVMNRFRNKSISVLVATDVAARGIDVSDLTHVINLNIPDDPEVYVHRSGRTGRAGAEGISMVITNGRNMRKIKGLERVIGKQFEPQLVPDGDQICAIKMEQAVEEIVELEPAELPEEMQASIMERMAHLSKEELIERFIGHELDTIMSRYRGARDINEKAKPAKEKGSFKRDSSGKEKGFATIVVDLGYRQKVNPSRLIGLLNDTMDGEKVRIGKIDMDSSFSRIDVEEAYAPIIADRLNGAKTGSYFVSAYLEEAGGASVSHGSNRRERRTGGYKGGKDFKRGGKGGGRSFDRDNRRDRSDRGDSRGRRDFRGDSRSDSRGEFRGDRRRDGRREDRRDDRGGYRGGERRSEGRGDSRGGYRSDRGGRSGGRPSGRTGGARRTRR